MESTETTHDENWPESLIAGYRLSSEMRDINSSYIGMVLTLLEISMPQGPQLDALKASVKQRLWGLADEVQNSMYRYIQELGEDSIHELELAFEKKRQESSVALSN